MKKLNPEARYYETNEWAVKTEKYFLIGITDFAQTVFGEITFVELPNIGTELVQGKPFAVIESNKAANEIISPLSGKIIAVNTTLLAQPNLLNTAPYKEGWTVKIEATISAEWEALMTALEYSNFVGSFFNKG